MVRDVCLETTEWVKVVFAAHGTTYTTLYYKDIRDFQNKGTSL